MREILKSSVFNEKRDIYRIKAYKDVKVNLTILDGFFIITLLNIAYVPNYLINIIIMRRFSRGGIYWLSSISNITVPTSRMLERRPRGRSNLARRPAHRYAGQEHKDRPNNGIFKEMVEQGREGGQKNPRQSLENVGETGRRPRKIQAGPKCV